MISCYQVGRRHWDMSDQLSADLLALPCVSAVMDQSLDVKMLLSYGWSSQRKEVIEMWLLPLPSFRAGHVITTCYHGDLPPLKEEPYWHWNLWLTLGPTSLGKPSICPCSPPSEQVTPSLCAASCLLHIWYFWIFTFQTHKSSSLSLGSGWGPLLCTLCSMNSFCMFSSHVLLILWDSCKDEVLGAVLCLSSTVCHWLLAEG